MSRAAISDFVLTASCSAAAGIVAQVTSFLWSKGCYLVALNQFDDQASGNFFMRTEGRIDTPGVTLAQLAEEFESVADKIGITYEFRDILQPLRTLVMVGKADHCLNDLLYRWKKGELPIEITAVVSNHQDLRPMVEREGIRYVQLPVTKENKAKQEARLLEIVEETDTELVVLARYMQVLSDSLCESLKGRAINIHHSFLPGFKGAKPYHQAFERGVKLIGATAHYVTADLDEGPIIAQSVQAVDHAFSPADLVAAGRDTETVALARAVRWHAEQRVLLDGNRTVVFQ